MGCGIIVYLGDGKPVRDIVRALAALEDIMYPGEKTPVGGHGAGIAWLDRDGRMRRLRLPASALPSPARRLLSLVPDDVCIAAIGHVRRASERFLDTITYEWGAQPFLCRCLDDILVYCAHNGFVKNYAELCARLEASHRFETRHAEAIRDPPHIIDSEVVPHLIASLLAEGLDPMGIAPKLLGHLEGGNTVAALISRGDSRYMLLAHKGMTRGLVVSLSEEGELYAASRPEALLSLGIKASHIQLAPLCELRRIEDKGGRFHVELALCLPVRL